MTVEGTARGHAPDIVAVVRFGKRRWLIRLGHDVTFGRGVDRDIRFGHNPDDDLVSRRAGLLTGERDGVLIRNSSHTQAFRLIAMPGPEFVIRPGMVVGSMPFSQTRLDILGRYGRRYSLHIETSDIPGAPQPLSEGPDNDGHLGDGHLGRARGSTQFGPDRLTPRELRLLAALCEPLLTLAGAAPATYREIAERLGGTATVNSVRTGLDRLRHRLAHDNGIPGLRGDDDDPQTSRDAAHYVHELARWTLDTHQIDGQTIHLVLGTREPPLSGHEQTRPP
jgi:hypothetical protein